MWESNPLYPRGLKHFRMYVNREVSPAGMIVCRNVAWKVFVVLLSRFDPQVLPKRTYVFSVRIPYEKRTYGNLSFLRIRKICIFPYT